jgi:hypothetical protein
MLISKTFCLIHDSTNLRTALAHGGTPSETGMTHGSGVLLPHDTCN